MKNDRHLCIDEWIKKNKMRDLETSIRCVIEAHDEDDPGWTVRLVMMAIREDSYQKKGV